MKRCAWAEVDDLYRAYHDEEWGVPVFEDRKLFEFLVLESFQAGLSWHTILRKRENFRLAFDDFNYRKISQYTNSDIDRLLHDSGIIRNRLKILAAINNAQRFEEIQQEFNSFSAYIWNFIDGHPIINYPENAQQVPASTPLSDVVAKDFKKRGFKFLGSTTVYAYLQAMGLVNDHVINCHCKTEL